jgi:hypothetical protein
VFRQWQLTLFFKLGTPSEHRLSLCISSCDCHYFNQDFTSYDWAAREYWCQKPVMRFVWMRNVHMSANQARHMHFVSRSTHTSTFPPQLFGGFNHFLHHLIVRILMFGSVCLNLSSVPPPPTPVNSNCSCPQPTLIERNYFSFLLPNFLELMYALILQNHMFDPSWHALWLTS